MESAGIEAFNMLDEFRDAEQPMLPASKSDDDSERETGVFVPELDIDPAEESEDTNNESEDKEVDVESDRRKLISIRKTSPLGIDLI